MATKRTKTITRLDELTPDPQNARTHNPRNVGLIETAIREVGAARSGVIDEDGMILAGNATWEALAAAGVERVRVVQAKGDEWVVVQRSGLSDEQKRRLALIDNRAAELAAWNPETLRAMSESTPAVLSDLFSAAEMNVLLGGAGLLPAPSVEAEWQGMPAFEQTDQSAYRSIVVHFPDAAAVEAFKAEIGQTFSDKAKYIWFPPQENDSYLAEQYVAGGEDDHGAEE